jgi:hypothetical protein
MTATFRPVAEPLLAPPPSKRLADLGFLSGPDLPDRPGPAYLLVALRDEPTLRHYDPERIEYWTSQRGRGVREELSRATPMPLDRPFSWGMIRLVDRRAATNEYLTFGGRLSAAEVDGATIAVFTSPAPMLRRGGHSQIWDEGTQELGAFFARMIAAVDMDPALETRLAAADPLVRYGVFLADVVERYRASPELRTLDPASWTLLRAEESLMRREHADAWHEGTTILAESRSHARRSQ